MDQMAPKWVKYRCACAFEALETTTEAFKMMFCALKRSSIIFTMMKKGESYGESSGVIFTSFSEVSTRFSFFFSLQIAHKMQMTHHLTHYSTPPQHGCAIFAKNSHGPSVHGVLMTHRTYNYQNHFFLEKSRLRLVDDFF